MSLHLRFFAAIDRIQSLDTPVLATSLGDNWPQFMQRGWVTDEGHLTHVMAPSSTPNVKSKSRLIRMQAAIAIAAR